VTGLPSVGKWGPLRSIRKAQVRWQGSPPCFWHGWELSPLSARSDIGLSPLSDHSNIRPKGCQSDIISEIRLTFLAIYDIRYIKFFLYICKYCIYIFRRIHTLVARFRIVLGVGIAPVLILNIRYRMNLI
jgi:hypothetical protein